MGIRAGGDPLAEVVPDLDQLMEDPRYYLTQGPLLFGPRSYLTLAALFGVPGLIVLGLWLAAPAELERLALGIGLLFGASIWLIYSLGSAGHSLFLGPDGVEIRYRDTTVFCPWDLFDCQGDIWTAAGQEHPTAGVTLPINAAAVPLIIWRRGVIELGRGMQVRAPQAWLLSPHELVLPGRYELRSEDLGKLLLVLGTRLGGRVPSTRLRDPQESALPGAFPEPDAQGYYTLSLTRFLMPPCCCCCAGEPERTMILTARSKVTPWLGAMPGSWSPAGQIITVEVPVCEQCHAREQSNAQRAILRWMWGLALAGLVSGLFAPAEAQGMAMLIGAMGGSVLGLFIGGLVGVSQPLDLRGYNPSTGTLQVRFRNREVEKRYREWRTRA